MQKNKMYAQLGSYNQQLIVPVELLARIVEEGFFVRSGWESGVSKEVINDVTPITDVKFVTDEEIRVVLAQKALASAQ